MAILKTILFSLLLGFVSVLARNFGADYLPHPSELALQLGEEEFEDYLDYWLSLDRERYANVTSKNTGDCRIRINGDLGQPQPVYLKSGSYLQPSGNTGFIDLFRNEEVGLHCTGNNRFLSHPNAVQSNLASAVVRCSQNDLVTGAWLSGHSEFQHLVCTNHAFHDAARTNRRCAGSRTVIEVGFIVDSVKRVLYESCFDEQRLEVLYVKYRLTPENQIHQSGVERPSFLPGSFYPGLVPNTQYTQVTQKQTIAAIVGADLADKYVTPYQFLARGHLSAKTDFVFATGQRASFYFINVAPQWQPFNAGNWNLLEQNLRVRIGTAGYKATIYTGTWGVTQLRDQHNTLRDIYLYTDANNNPQLPVPLYFYKVVHDELSNRGVAFVGINNPYYTLAEIRNNLVFCRDRCRDNSNYSWINWSQENITSGYSFCCEVDDFRSTVNHLPSFTTSGLLY